MPRNRSNTSSTCDSFTEWHRAYPEEARVFLARNAARCRPWAENVRPGAPSTSSSRSSSNSSHRPHNRDYDSLGFWNDYQFTASISPHSSASQTSHSRRRRRDGSQQHGSERTSHRDASQTNSTHRLPSSIVPQYYTPRYAEVESQSDPLPRRSATVSRSSGRRNAYTDPHTTNSGASRDTTIYSSLSRAAYTPTQASRAPSRHQQQQQQYQQQQQLQGHRYLSACGRYYIEDRTPDMYR